MKKYLNSFDAYYKKRKAEFSERDNRYYGTYLWDGQEQTSVMSKEFHTYEFLTQMYSLLDQAENAINGADYDQETKNKLIDRIRLERFTVTFFIAEFHSDKFSKNDYNDFLNEFKDECERLGVSHIKRRKTNEQVFDEWRNKKQLEK